MYILTHIHYMHIPSKVPPSTLRMYVDGAREGMGVEGLHLGESKSWSKYLRYTLHIHPHTQVQCTPHIHTVQYHTNTLFPGEQQQQHLGTTLWRASIDFPRGVCCCFDQAQNRSIYLNLVPPSWQRMSRAQSRKKNRIILRFQISRAWGKITICGLLRKMGRRMRAALYAMLYEML